MKSLEFLVWRTGALGLYGKKTERLFQLLTRSCALTENNINKSGGIGGLPVKIYFKVFDEGKKGIGT